MTPFRRKVLLEHWAQVRKSAEELIERLGSVEPEHDDFVEVNKHPAFAREAERNRISDFRQDVRRLGHVADERIADLIEQGGKF